MDLSEFLFIRAQPNNVGGLTYMPTTPCNRGHMTPRWKSNYCCIECQKLHRQLNLGSYRARERKSQTARIKRCPQWVDTKALERIYKDCPAGYQVDHIIPLQGKLVSGFHVPENLQYLTTMDNLTKHNKFMPFYQQPDGTIEYVV